MNALALVTQERDRAVAEAAYLRSIVEGLADTGFEMPNETERFTARERQILSILHSHKGKIVRHQSMQDLIYFDREVECDATIKVIISKMRGKLINHRIENVFNVGYRLVEIAPR